MSEDQNLSFMMRIKGAMEVQRGLAQTAKATKTLGSTSKRTGSEQETAAKKARFFSRETALGGRAAKGATGHLRRMAGGLLAIGAGYASIHGAKDAVEKTVSLTKASYGLTRVYGLNKKAASEYVIVADTLGVSQDSLERGLKMMSKSSQTAAGGMQNLTLKHKDASKAARRLRNELHELSKPDKRISQINSEMSLLGSGDKSDAKRVKMKQRIADIEISIAKKKADVQRRIDDIQSKNAEAGAGAQAEAYAKVGVSMKMLKRGNASEIFETAAEGLKKMKGGTEKAAITNTIFGRGAKSLNAILAQGGKGLREWRQRAREAAEQLNPKQVKEYVENQREMKLMWTEIQLELGNYLLPKFHAGEVKLKKFMMAFKKGKGPAGDLKKVLKVFGTVIDDVFTTFAKHPKVLDAFVIALAGATVGMIAFDVATAANPFGLIALGVIAGTVAIIELVKHLTAVSDWILGHKALVLIMMGPLGLLILSLAKVGSWLGDLRDSTGSWGDVWSTVLGKIKLKIYKFLLRVTDVMGHLPGAIGKPFRKAGDAIRADIDKTQAKLNGLNTKKARDEFKAFQSTVDQFLQSTGGALVTSLNTNGMPNLSGLPTALQPPSLTPAGPATAPRRPAHPAAATPAPAVKSLRTKFASAVAAATPPMPDVVVALDGKVLARAVVKQGKVAEARA